MNEMARRTIDMNEAFLTVPNLPEHFEENCLSMLPRIPIFFKRKDKTADCLCGKCGSVFITSEKPVRNGYATCLRCGTKGYWEWSKVTRERYDQQDITLVQCTKDRNIVLRMFSFNQKYKQGYIADIKMKERRRFFLHIGDVYKFYNASKYTCRGWERQWGRESDHEYFDTSRLYPGWEKEIKKSNLKYCNPVLIARVAKRNEESYVNTMIAYANNPAIEMYAKTEMIRIVNHLLAKEGKTKYINRRAKNIYSQLRIENKSALNRLIKARGEIIQLEILQKEKKLGIHFTEEQERFIKRRDKEYRGIERMEYLLQYMTLQQLINRTEKYIQQGEYVGEGAVLRTYEDYIKMREELGYDMANELYIYPKNLKMKHDQMVLERDAKRDKDHITKMNAKYPEIANRYKKLCKTYLLEDDEYIIRPASGAGEIVEEGRFLHHCVGGENYLSKHNTGKTTILFLRKKQTPDVPYYTIEIKDGEILQWYGMRDKKPDIEVIGPWLDSYVKYITQGKCLKKAS